MPLPLLSTEKEEVYRELPPQREKLPPSFLELAANMEPQGLAMPLIGIPIRQLQIRKDKIQMFE